MMRHLVESDFDSSMLANVRVCLVYRCSFSKKVALEILLSPELVTKLQQKRPD